MNYFKFKEFLSFFFGEIDIQIFFSQTLAWEISNEDISFNSKHILRASLKKYFA